MTKVCKDSENSPIRDMIHSIKCDNCYEDCDHENVKYFDCLNGVYCMGCGMIWGVLNEAPPEIHQFYFSDSCKICHCIPCCCDKEA